MPVTCFDIGGTFLRYGVRTPDGEVAEAGRCPVPKDNWQDFVAALSTGLAETQGTAVSISITGSYDPADGMATVANLPCVDGRYFQAELSEHLGCRVLVTNDADCFALAEAFQGAGRDAPIVFAIILGSGVGGGVVANGALVRGFGGVTGEWGHGPVLTHGPGGEDTPPLKCGCGLAGCLDVIGSARGMENIHFGLHGQRLPSNEITTAWQEGDAEAVATLDYYLDVMSRHLAMIVNVLGPTVIPVGGGLSNDTKLIAALDAAVRARTNARFDSALVVPGHHVKDGGLVGAGIAARLANLEV